MALIKYEQSTNLNSRDATIERPRRTWRIFAFVAAFWALLKGDFPDFSEDT